MLTTAIAILAAVALLMPGFLVAEIALARGARSSRSDLELALRALSYALIVHLVFGFWTVRLVEEVGAIDQWSEHLRALSTYAFVVLVAVPTALGLLLNVILAHVEAKDGPTPLWAAALGAGQARDAYDFAFQHSAKSGAWIIIELVGHSAEVPRLIGGLYGRGSAVGQTPSSHDIFLERLYVVAEDEHGVRQLTAGMEPARSVYVPANQIARLEILAPTDTL